MNKEDVIILMQEYEKQKVLWDSKKKWCNNLIYNLVIISILNKKLADKVIKLKKNIFYMYKSSKYVPYRMMLQCKLIWRR